MIKFRDSILAILIFVLPFTLNAQELQEQTNASTVGPWTIGGNLNFNTANRNNLFLLTDLRVIPILDKSSNFSVNPVLTYGLTNYLSANLILGYSRGKQSGIVNILEDVGAFSEVPMATVGNQYSIGLSVDRYMILKKYYGFRLELGVVYSDFKNTSTIEAYTFNGNTRPEQIAIVNGKAIGPYFSPNIDLFLGSRINIAIGLGNIGYLYSSYAGRNLGENELWQFETNLTLDDVGIGIEFNF